MNGNIGTLTIEMAANVVRLQRDMNRVRRVIDSSLAGIKSQLSGIFGVATAALSLRELGQMADAYSNMQARLKLATRDATEFAQANEHIKRIAASSASSLEETANLYTRISSAILDVGGSQKQVADTTQALALSLRISGASTAESASAMQQFSQAMASGVLRGEEFNSVNEAAPRVMKALADSIGVPVGQLRTMAEQGKLTRDILIDALGSQLPKLLAEASTLPKTMSSAWTDVRNELLLTVGGIDKITGASSGAAKAIGLMASGLKELRGIFSPSEAAQIAKRLDYIGKSMDDILLRRRLLGKIGIDASGFWGDDLNKLNSEAIKLQDDLQKLGVAADAAEKAAAIAADEAAVRAKKKAEETAKAAEAEKKRIEAQKEAEKAAKAAIEAAKASEKAANSYIVSLRQETEEIGLNATQVKLLAAARAAAAAPLESQRMEIMAQAQAWAETTIAQEANVEAARRLEAEEKKRLDGYADLVAADEKSLESLKQKNDLLEFGAEAVARMGQADLQAALDRAWAADNIDIKVIDMLERRLELSKQLAAEAKRGEALEAARDAAKAADTAWQNTARDINRSLTDALLRGFESGKSFAENLRDTIKHMFQTLILRPVIDVALSPVSRSIMSVMGGVGGVGATGSAAAGGMGGMAGAAGGTGMLAGLMTTMGPALAAAGAAFAIGSLTSSFGSGKKIFGIKGDSPLNFIAPIIGIAAGLFGAGPKKLGPAELTGDFLSDGFHGEFQADWTRKVGLFGGKKRGRRGLGIERDQLDAINSTMFDIQGVFDSLADTAGDATRSLSGWNFSVKQQIETEEQRTQLAKDLANSLGAHLIPELVDLQHTGETLADTAARVQAEYVLVNAALDLTGQKLNQTGLASLGLRDSLVQTMGGLQNAGSLLQPFFENFYSDAERVASTGRLMNAELVKLGVTIPQTREQFRALVEAQDLNTDAGQKMFAALLRLAPAFASVTDAIGQAAAEAEAEAKRILDSMQLLPADAFKTAFEYTRYMRLAANAGVTAAQPAQIFEASPAQVFPSFAVGTNSLPQDMTINAHAGERIIPAADNRELMQRLKEPNAGIEALVSEVRQLRAENKAQALAIARNTAATTKILDRWEGGGMPEVRVA